MQIDERSKILIDFERVLAELHPITPFGLKLKNNLKPYGPQDKEELEAELERVNGIKEIIGTQKALVQQIKDQFRTVKDLHRSIENAIHGYVLTIVELFELKHLSYAIKESSRLQRQLELKLPDCYEIKELPWLEGLLDPDNSGIRTFYIYDSYSVELAAERKEISRLEGLLDSSRRKLVKQLEAELDIPIKITGEVTLQKNNHELLHRLKQEPRLYLSGETYMNATFRLKPDEELLKLQKQLEDLRVKEAMQEQKVLEKLSKAIGKEGHTILADMEAIGRLDLLLAKGELAIAQNAVKPLLNSQMQCVIQKGRNPIVEQNLKRKGKAFTPISVQLQAGVAIITGANMGGKTVSLKLIGLLCTMVHYGLLVPADYMETALFDYISISAGDEQSVDKGLSTFGAEMKSIKGLLEKAQQKGLILIDELARGTNPREGYAISRAIIHYFMNTGSITVITTHHDNLVQPGIKHLQVKGLRDLEPQAVLLPEHISDYMDYTLIELSAEAEVPKDAIKISRLLGIPEEIISYAEELMTS